MKKITIIIILITLLFSGSLMSQVNVGMETTMRIDSTHDMMPVNRIMLNTKIVNFKYDYFSHGGDVMGVFVPKIVGDSTGEIGAAVIGLGDWNKEERLVLDAWGRKTYGKFTIGLEIGRIINPDVSPWDFSIIHLGYSKWHLVGQIGMLLHHPVTEKTGPDDNRYFWLAFHPKYAYIAVGGTDETYWALAGTKDLKKFGNFTFLNYNTKNDNFWFRTQFGFGTINQKFFNEDLYNIAAEYFCMPPFFFRHFSPIATKGTYSFKIDGKRTGAVQNYEAIAGHTFGNNIIGLAAGINTEIKDGKLRAAPSVELYKSFTIKDQLTASLELRYDALYKVMGGYFIISF